MIFRDGLGLVGRFQWALQPVFARTMSEPKNLAAKVQAR
jgi:hypothetical protein